VPHTACTAGTYFVDSPLLVAYRNLASGSFGAVETLACCFSCDLPLSGLSLLDSRDSGTADLPSLPCSVRCRQSGRGQGLQWSYRGLVPGPGLSVVAVGPVQVMQRTPGLPVESSQREPRRMMATGSG